MTTESLQKQIDEQKITDRAMELFEAQSPHQLAVTLAHFEAKHAEAMSALDRTTDQRDQLAAQLNDATAQLAAQLNDATAQLARAGDLLREARDVWDFHEDPEAATLVHASGISIRLWMENVDGYLAGEVPPPAVPKGWRLVPEEVTAYQVLVGRNVQPTDDELCVSIYLAMLAAAPKPEGQ